AFRAGIVPKSRNPRPLEGLVCRTRGLFLCGGGDLLDVARQGPVEPMWLACATTVATRRAEWCASCWPQCGYPTTSEKEHLMKKTASAVWKGGFKDGKGVISTESGALQNAPYGFNTRFEGAKGTNPEELIGAAHAGCFSMALSVQLGLAQLTAESIETEAAVTLEKQGDGFAITAVHLNVTAR